MWSFSAIRVFVLLLWLGCLEGNGGDLFGPFPREEGRKIRKNRKKEKKERQKEKKKKEERKKKRKKSMEKKEGKDGRRNGP